MADTQNEKELATEKALKMVKGDKIKADEMADCIVTYQDFVLKQVNEKRSYCQSQMKEAVEKYWQENNETIPTVHQIYACSLQNATGDRMEKIFDFHIDKLLPTVMGTNEWRPNVKCYYEISSAKCRCDSSKSLIPAGTEAFLVLLYENCHKKWVNWFPKVKADKKYKVDRKDNTMKAKYTMQEGGQKEFTGWKKQGLQRFKKLKELILECRKAAVKEQEGHNKAEEDRKREAMEKNPGAPVGESQLKIAKFFQSEANALQRLRKANGISCDDAATEKRIKRKRKRNAEATVIKEPEERVSTIDFDD